ncbi:MAG: hypothetical protein LBE84_03120 [Planctomycetota bacterium]|jgi:hypothetical protein|nr:hypothetical protein [Planctomycetota bacterium]
MDDQEQKSDLMAFTGRPFDARSAAIMQFVFPSRQPGDAADKVLAMRTSGAPIVFVERDGDIDWWMQGLGQGADRHGELIK